ncbi:MAG: DUF302 domain-containing protein [Dehalococcoidia bacterium]
MPGYFDDYTVETEKDVETATASIQQKAGEKGFTVMGVHDLQAIFGRKGFQHEPVRVVEMCNEEFGSHLLAVDPMMSLMMPCKIVVYSQNGRTYISALRPRAMGDYVPQLAPLAEQGDSIMCSIVEEAK